MYDKKREKERETHSLPMNTQPVCNETKCSFVAIRKSKNVFKTHLTYYSHVVLYVIQLRFNSIVRTFKIVLRSFCRVHYHVIFTSRKKKFRSNTIICY